MDETKRECTHCHRVLPISRFPIRSQKRKRKPHQQCDECLAAYQRRYRDENRTRINRDKQKYAERIRLEGIAVLGGQCQCCGENNVAFLTLDHIEGRTETDYHASGERRTEKGAWMRARKEGWPRDRYQILCFNCNCAKGAYGICPHQLLKGGDAI